MPLTLSSTAIEEKNKLATDSAFLILLEITIPGTDDMIRVVNNTEDITWNSLDWTRTQFDLDTITTGSTGEVTSVELRVDNTQQVLEYYIHSYEAWCKVNYREPILCTIYVVNSLNLADPTAEAEYDFQLIQPKSNPLWITFTLGASNPFDKRYPRTRLIPVCPWKFKGSRCLYAGAETSCNKTFDRCKTLDNTLHFRGFFVTGRPSR